MRPLPFRFYRARLSSLPMTREVLDAGSVNAIRNAECPEDMDSAPAPAPAPVSAAEAAELFAQAEAAEQANPPATVGSVASEIIFEADIHAIAEGTAARVEFELGFAEEMARSLGDGAPT